MRSLPRPSKAMEGLLESYAPLTWTVRRVLGLRGVGSVSTNRTPFIGPPSASRVSGLEVLGVETPPIGSIGIARLIFSINRSWDTRENVRAETINGCPHFKVGRGRPTVSWMQDLEGRSQ
jgi:hypothetical protein